MSARTPRSARKNPPSITRVSMPERRGLLGERPAAEAHERHVYAAREVLQQRVYVGLRPAGVPAADEMYDFQGCKPPLVYS